MNIAIVGKGVTGSILAIQLHRFYALKKLPHQITIFEKSSDANWHGVAYTLKNETLYLNVKVEKMSPFKDDPEHFYRWLKNKNYNYELSDFVPRKIYSDYLKSCEEEFILGNDHIKIVHDEITDIENHSTSRESTLSGLKEKYTSFQKVYLCLGNLQGKSMPHLLNPWKDFPPQIDEDAFEVLIVGTGLTMVDSVLMLKERYPKVKITAISRKGNIPRPNTHQMNKKTFEWDFSAKNNLLLSLLHQLNLNKRNMGKENLCWGRIIDSLRPHTNTLWATLSTQEKKQFSKYLWSYWNTYRHRLPEFIHKKILNFIASGELVVKATKFQDIDTTPFRFMVNCLGPEYNLEKIHHPLIQNLLKKGMLVPHAFGMGAELDSLGMATKNLSVLGNMRIGTALECTAVPDLSEQIFKQVNILQ